MAAFEAIKTQISLWTGLKTELISQGWSDDNAQMIVMLMIRKSLQE